MTGIKVNGGTLRKRPRDHDCMPPAVKSNDLQPGDYFDCDCGSHWVVVSSPDPHEPEPYWHRETRGRPA